MQSIADWMIFQKPLYMGRIVRSRTRSGINFIVEEANENQNRKWFAFSLLDESGDAEGIADLTHKILNGRHKLITKHNQLKYSEDFYASLNNNKIKELLGSDFSSMGGQWIQISGIEDVNMSYAWLVLSPWGKIWMSRLAILCLALSRMESLSTSDMVDQTAISLKDLPQPMHTLASSSLHTNRQGDSTIKDNHTIVSSYNPTRRFKSDPADKAVQDTFGYLYGIEQYAAVRGDGLIWNSEAISKTLGRTAITGLTTLLTGGGFWGFGASLLDQGFERYKYLNSTMPEKVKQQCEDLYSSALIITEIAKQSKDNNVVFVAEKLRQAVDDFRKTIPLKFEGKNYDTKSFYYGTPEELRKGYRNVFAESQVPTKPSTTPPSKPKNSDSALGISEPEDKSLTSQLDLDRLPEAIGLGVKNRLAKPSRFNANSWGSVVAPIIAPHIERAIAIHNISGPGMALSNQSDHMREILGEIRVLAREYDNANKSNIYSEIEVATNIVNSFLSKIKNSLPDKQQTETPTPNYKDVPGTGGKVYE